MMLQCLAMGVPQVFSGRTGLLSAIGLPQPAPGASRFVSDELRDQGRPFDSVFELIRENDRDVARHFYKKYINDKVDEVIRVDNTLIVTRSALPAIVKG